MSKDYNIEDAVNEYSDKELEFRARLLKTMKGIKELSNLFDACEYDILFKLNAKRQQYPRQIKDIMTLDGTIGKISSRFLGELVYVKRKPNFITPSSLCIKTKHGQFLTSLSQAQTLIGEMITCAYEQAKNKTFKIIGVDYFSFLKYHATQEPLLDAAYFSSRRGYFVRKK